MKPCTKFAAAALIITAALIGINQFNLPIDGAAPAFADVYTKVMQENTIKYRTKTYIPHESTPREEIIWISDDYGVIRESYIKGRLSVIQYTSLKEKRKVSVLPEEKQYIEIIADEEHFTKLKESESSPKELVQRMRDGKHKSLGKALIDGIEAIGFESNDPKVSGSQFINLRIWADMHTLYPVRIERENSILDESKTGNERIIVRSIIDDFQWNVTMSESAFTPVIPLDFTLNDTIQYPRMDENAAINGLRKFAELTGRFPASFGINEFMEEVNKAIKDSMDTDTLNNLSSQQKREHAAPFHSLLIFYELLLNDKKDPVYHGDCVSPQDTDAVLLRWKTYSSQYRVIFGDLSVAELSYDDLCAIESEAHPVVP